jgi:hypothetical protein
LLVFLGIIGAVQLLVPLRVMLMEAGGRFGFMLALGFNGGARVLRLFVRRELMAARA